MKRSTVSLGVNTKKELIGLGEFGETYEDVIKRLIKHYKETKK